ncbi:MAG TPA: GNAT family N-acetyltransferase [Pseudomonadales bacterium]
MLKDPDVFVRRVAREDRDEFLELMQVSRSLHEPWISPPLTPRAFDAYLARMQRNDHDGLLVRRREDEAIVGVINLNNIMRGSFLSASLGYYAGKPYSGRGYMTAGLKATVQFAFDELGLHRLEANIQPNNAPSLNLVRRCGFRNEGFSPRLLFIAGQWRDHERWAIYHPRDTLVHSR